MRAVHAHAALRPAATITRHGACLSTKSTVWPKIVAVPAPRRAEDDDLRAAALGLLDDRAARVAARGRRARPSGRRTGAAIARSLVEQVVGVVDCSARSASSGSSSGTTITRSRTIRPARSVARRAATSTASCDSSPGDDRHEDRAVLERERRPERDRRPRRSPRSGSVQPPAVEDVEDEAGGEPGEARVARRRVLDDDDEPGGAGAEPADDREERPVDPANRSGSAGRATRAPRRGCRARSAITATCAIVNESIAPNAYIRPRKSTWPESRKSVGTMPAKTTSESHGVFSFGCSRRNTSGSCR